MCAFKVLPLRRPAELNTLIHDGCPDVLRGEVWQLLAKIHSNEADLTQNYRILIEKVCTRKWIHFVRVYDAL